jgi:hypothetical protein
MMKKKVVTARSTVATVSLMLILAGCSGIKSEPPPPDFLTANQSGPCCGDDGAGFSFPVKGSAFDPLPSHAHALSRVKDVEKEPRKK